MTNNRSRGLQLLIGLAAVALLPGCGHHQDVPPATARADSAQAASSEAAAPVRRAKNSSEILAGCQPESRATSSSVHNFQVDERYNRAGIQVKVRFVVNNNGFVMNPYIQGAQAVSAGDQEAALDYVRHLTFVTASAEECQTVTVPMVGMFRMSKDAGDEWITIFESHPVYSYSGDKVVVNPN